MEVFMEYRVVVVESGSTIVLEDLLPTLSPNYNQPVDD